MLRTTRDAVARIRGLVAAGCGANLDATRAVQHTLETSGRPGKTPSNIAGFTRKWFYTELGPQEHRKHVGSTTVHFRRPLGVTRPVVVLFRGAKHMRHPLTPIQKARPNSSGVEGRGNSGAKVHLAPALRNKCKPEVRNSGGDVSQATGCASRHVWSKIHVLIVICMATSAM